MAVVNQVGNSLTGSTGTGAFVGATSPALVLPSANNFIGGYATTVTAAGTTTLTVSSAQNQFFTGATTQTLKMPVTSTLTLGQYWDVINDSTFTVTVVASDSSTITTLAPNGGDVTGSTARLTCVSISDTTSAGWMASGNLISYSFTPTLSCTTPGDLSVAYTTQVANVQRVGSFNFFNIYLACTPTYTTATGTINVSGFVTASRANNVFFWTQVGGTAYTPPANLVGYYGGIASGTNAATIQYNRSATGPAAALPITAFTTANAMVIEMQGFYI